MPLKWLKNKSSLADVMAEREVPIAFEATIQVRNKVLKLTRQIMN